MKRSILTRLSPALLALACACTVGVSTTAHAQRVPIGTNEISFTDYEAAVPGWDYGYWYSDGNLAGGTYSQDRTWLDLPHLTNHVFKYTFDDTVFAGFASWYGTGFGMPLIWNNDPLSFNSTDLSDYLLSFDAKVEGLLPGTTGADCRMEFRLGTSPPVGNNPTWALVKAFTYAPGSNWTHFVFNLDQGSFIGADGQPTTSLQSFLAGISTGITDVRFNQNQPEPGVEFGTDGDNLIYIDNIKLQVKQYAGPPPVPPPQVALNVWDYNFDDKGLWWIWPAYPATTAGWAANANRGLYWGVNPAVGEGVGGSNALQMGFDNTGLFTDPPGIPSWSGGNMSAGGQTTLSQMKSANLQDYRVTVDARVAGLADPAAGNAPFILQFIFNSPDGTLGATNGSADMLLRLNLTVSGVKTGWQTFTKTLKDASVDSGSLANFETHLSKLSEIQFQIQTQNPHSASTWGQDADNQINIDNFKLDRMVVGTPPLTTSVEGSKLTVTWGPPSSGTVELQSASDIKGPWTTVTGATSPYVADIVAPGAPKFYRTSWIAPPPASGTRLLALLPGETPAFGSAPGKTGTPDIQLANLPVQLKVYAVDDSYNVVFWNTHTVKITSTDTTATLPADKALVNGSATFDVIFNTGGTWTVTASDVTDPTKIPGTASVTVQ